MRIFICDFFLHVFLPYYLVARKREVKFFGIIIVWAFYVITMLTQALFSCASKYILWLITIKPQKMEIYSKNVYSNSITQNKIGSSLVFLLLFLDFCLTLYFKFSSSNPVWLLSLFVKSDYIWPWKVVFFLLHSHLHHLLFCCPSKKENHNLTLNEKNHCKVFSK